MLREKDAMEKKIQVWESEVKWKQVGFVFNTFGQCYLIIQCYRFQLIPFVYTCSFTQWWSQAPWPLHCISGSQLSSGTFIPPQPAPHGHAPFKQNLHPKAICSCVHFLLPAWLRDLGKITQNGARIYGAQFHLALQQAFLSLSIAVHPNLCHYPQTHHAPYISTLPDIPVMSYFNEKFEPIWVHSFTLTLCDNRHLHLLLSVNIDIWTYK